MNFLSAQSGGGWMQIKSNLRGKNAFRYQILLHLMVPLLHFSFHPSSFISIIFFCQLSSLPTAYSIMLNSQTISTCAKPIQNWLPSPGYRKRLRALNVVSNPPSMAMKEQKLEDLELRLGMRYLHACHGDVETAIFLVDRSLVSPTTRFPVHTE